MEKFTYKKIQLDLLDTSPVYSPRLDAYGVPQPLGESIARQGVVMPLIVTDASRPVIIAGHRRCAAARQAGLSEIPVLALNAGISAREAFLMAVLSNWQMQWDEVDRAYCLGRAVREFGLAPEGAVQILLPALGLEPLKHVFEDYFEASRLEAPLLKAIQEKLLPYKGAQQLVRFSKQDQTDFAALIAQRASLTSQELLKVQDWLRGLLKQSGKGLRETLVLTGAETILAQSSWDRRIKGEKLCQVLREQAHPALTSQEKAFSEALKAVPEFSGDFKLEAPPFFEEQGYQLRAKIKNKADLVRYRQLLEKHGEWLNSLFDFML